MLYVFRLEIKTVTPYQVQINSQFKNNRTQIAKLYHHVIENLETATDTCDHYFLRTVRIPTLQHNHLSTELHYYDNWQHQRRYIEQLVLQSCKWYAQRSDPMHMPDQFLHKILNIKNAVSSQLPVAQRFCKRNLNKPAQRERAVLPETLCNRKKLHNPQLQTTLSIKCLTAAIINCWRIHQSRAEKYRIIDILQQ